MYPGAASSKSTAGFWSTAINAEDLPMVIPFNRWAIEHYYDPNVTGVCLAVTLSLLSRSQFCAHTLCVFIFLMQLEKCMFDLPASSLMWKCLMQHSSGMLSSNYSQRFRCDTSIPNAASFCHCQADSCGGVVHGSTIAYSSRTNPSGHA